MSVQNVSEQQNQYFRMKLQEARREKLERMGEEILDLWQQLGIGKDEQVEGGMVGVHLVRLATVPIIMLVGH